MTGRRQFLIAAAAGMRPAFAAGDLERQVRELRPKDVGAGERAVLENLDNRVREVLAAIPRKLAMPSRDRVAVLKHELERSLGFKQLPWPPDLKARNVGGALRQGCRFEKIVFQTFPGTQVPAHLYVPESLSGTFPAILFYTGHWWPDKLH